MKLTLSLLLIAVITFASEGFSQSAKLKLKMENATLVEIFQEIERTSDIGFLFKNEQLDLSKKYSLDAENKSVEDIMNMLLGDKYNYQFLGNNIVITAKSEMVIAGQQQKTISGTVTDSTGAPLPGVTVVVKGTTNGTITDFDGKYTLPNVPENATIAFSFVGMKTQEVSVGGKTSVNITLKEDAIGIEEVVAIGYGTMKKSDLTGAVSSVSASDYGKVIKTSADQGLQGLAAGVLVTQNSSQPGGGVSIRIRGVSSLNSGNEPLYVIDGVPYDAGNAESGANFGPTISPLSSINPNDIENIEILKDASSTSIYGARGANGVILITTKSGKKGEGKIKLSSSIGFQNIKSPMDVMNASEYMDATNQALINDNDGDIELAKLENRWYSDEKRDSIGTGTNWLDQVLRTGIVQNYELSASGSQNDLVYYISLGHTKNNGVVKNSDFTRTSLRINLQNRFANKVVVGGNVSISDIKSNFIRTEGDRQNEGVSSVIYSSLMYRPVLSLYVNETDDELSVDQNTSNPLALVELITNSTRRINMFGNVFAEWEILKNLKLKTTGGFNYGNTRDNFYAPMVGSYNGALNKGLGRLGFVNSQSFVNTNSISYNKKIGNHSVNAVGAVELIKGGFYKVTDQAAGFVNDILREHDLSSGSNPSKPSNYTEEYSLLSYLTRINYNYKGKYLLSVTSRYDGSSRFGANNKYAFFPSASIGWNITKEDFMKEVKILNQLKLRVSYGMAGNQNIALYSSTSPLASDSYVIGNNIVTGFHATRIANPDLRWEKKEQINLGLDFGFFKGRISGSAEYYDDNTNDLLMAKQIPVSSGFSTVVSNIGSIKNSGLELTLNSVNLDKKLVWKTSFNVSFPKTTVNSLGDIDFFLAGFSNYLVKNTQIIEKGKPLGQFYGYEYDGIAQTQEDVAYTLGNTIIGDYKYKDISGPDGIPDGKIDATYDKTVIGNALPTFFGGITNTFTYRNLELSFFFQGTFGNDIMNLNRIWVETSIPNSNQLTSVLDAWTPENTEAKTRILSLSKTIAPDVSSRIVEDGSYIRLKSLSLSYRLPRHFVSRLKISDMQFTVTGQNLLTITKYSGMDPEVDAGRNNSLSFGHDFFGYPQSRIITTGVSLTF